MIRLVLADDHLLLQDGLVDRLQRQPLFEIVGTASDGETACELAVTLQPHVLLTDITMPGMNGIDVLKTLRREAPEVKVVMLSMHSNKEYILAAMHAGASGYLLKEISSMELVRALR